MNAEESYQAAVAEIRNALGGQIGANRVKRPVGRPRKPFDYEEPKVTLRAPIPERPTHCTCRNPRFGYPTWGVRWDRKCGRPEA